jgi:hypothetical protein
VSAYRQDQRWGTSLGEYHARRGSWFLAVLLGITFSIGLIHFAVNSRDPPAQSVAGAVLLPCVTLWFGYEWYRLGRVALHLYEHGLKFHDGSAEHALMWDDVASITGQYVPGVRGNGAEDEGNLVALIVACEGRRVVLPKELDRFSSVVEDVRSRVQAPYQKTVIANLMNRG